MPENEWTGTRRWGICFTDIVGLREAINMYKLVINLYMKELSCIVLEGIYAYWDQK
jgi:hypothetical protein